MRDRRAHRRLLDEVEGIGLAQAVALHQQVLGPVDQPTGLELVLRRRRAPVVAWTAGRLGFDGPLLLTAGYGLVDGGHQLGSLEWLDQVGGHAGVTGLFDEVALAEGGEDQDRDLISRSRWPVPRPGRRPRAS